MIKVVTHNGNFHSDDVFAMAALELYLVGEKLSVVRTRDEELISDADWVFDVGGVYSPEKLRFDHHQPDAPVRANGIPYAAFGLIWKVVGEKVAGSKEIAESLEESLVIPIDASDNGVALYELNDYQISPLDIQSFISKLNPIWGSDEDYDENFKQAVDFARTVLVRFIKNAEAKIKMAEIVENVYQTAEDKRVLVFDISVSSRLCVQYPEVQTIVFPDDSKVSNNWLAIAVPKHDVGFETRFSFPEEWGGLRNEELAKVSGIEDAVFCHRNCHLLITGSKESAVAAAEKFVL